MADSGVTLDAVRVGSMRASYGNRTVLRDVSFTIREGSVKALMGRSGTGKSTVLRCMCGLQPLEAGSVSLYDQPIIEEGRLLFEEWEIARHLAMVAQRPAVLPHMTARDNIALGLRCVLKMNGAEAMARVEAVSEELGITHVLNSYSSEMSGGELQRVHLARTLVLEPPVLLLDEVTSSVDPQTTRNVVESLWRVRKAKGSVPKAILVVTHLLDFARKFADEVVFLEDGRVAADGSVADVLTCPTHSAVTRFIDGLGHGSNDAATVLTRI